MKRLTPRSAVFFPIFHWQRTTRSLHVNKSLKEVLRSLCPLFLLSCLLSYTRTSSGNVARSRHVNASDPIELSSSSVTRGPLRSTFKCGSWERRASRRELHWLSQILRFPQKLPISPPSQFGLAQRSFYPSFDNRRHHRGRQPLC